MAGIKQLTKWVDEAKGYDQEKIIHDPDTSERFSELYGKIFGEDLCSTCPGSLQQAYYRIQHFSQTNLITMGKSKYRLKDKSKGAYVDTVYSSIPGVPPHITNDNLTDEIYKTLVDANPNYKKQFEIASEDEEPAEGPAPAGKEKSAANEKSDAVAELVENNTKQELIDQATKLQKKNKELKFEASWSKEELATFIVENK